MSAQDFTGCMLLQEKDLPEEGAVVHTDLCHCSLLRFWLILNISLYFVLYYVTWHLFLLHEVVCTANQRRLLQWPCGFRCPSLVSL